MLACFVFVLQDLLVWSSGCCSVLTYSVNMIQNAGFGLYIIISRCRDLRVHALMRSSSFARLHTHLLRFRGT
jgi:hypothetical protein